MRRLGLRARFALVAAGLVAVVASLVGVSAYLVLRHSLLARATTTGADQAHQLAMLVDTSGARGREQQGNRVDLTDPSLTHDFARSRLPVLILDARGRRIQASAPAGSLELPASARAACVRTGVASQRVAGPPLSWSCARAGPAAAPTGLVAVAVPLGATFDALHRLVRTLAIGVGAGLLLAALLAWWLAQRALRPVRSIAETAESIRSGDLHRRIDYEGPPDELGSLARTLDASFAELEQAVARQRRFVADASHELRTPIAAMRAHTELLRGWAAEAPEARDEALRSLDQATRRAGRLVADLLYLARLDRPAPVALAPTQIDEVVLTAIREAQPLRPDVPIRVERLDEAQLAADDLRLQQLVLNVLDNALRVSPPGEPVDVSVNATPEGVTVIAVADRGPGLRDDQLERIFDRFYTDGQRRSEGSGLGLAIAREIARAHGGEVRACNRPGGGTTMRVELPLAGALTEPAPAFP